MQVFQDPARINLRKAVRATLVVPLLFAATVVADVSTTSLFIAFGSFAALVFADFGGRLRLRFRAYLLLAVVGGVLVALGTAVADTLWPAALVTLVVAFAIALSGVFGGYFASGSVSATLAFVLGVMTPSVDAGLWAREAGWIIGVLAAGAAAVTLWPAHQRDRVRLATVSVMREVAKALATPGASRDLEAARAAARSLTERAGLVYRPAGSITRERALVALVIATRRLVPLAEAVTSADHTADADRLPEYGALGLAVANSLDDSAAVLAGDARPTAGVDDLVAARDAHTHALERWASATLDDQHAEEVVARFRATFPLRRLSLTALALAHNAELAAPDHRRPPLRPALHRAWLTLRAHCSLRSVRFRNAARAGLGLAIAVFVAKEMSLQHAFWVVLGALSVLRSNALGTGATALQALLGAIVGFGVATLLMTTVGGDDAILWVLLPIVVFLAAYTPGAVNFVVGQGAFTVFVVVLFNIIVPEGWRTGLVRVQDVAIGAAISVGVGALLWPRGARGVARREFADLLRAGARHLGSAVDASVGGGTLDGVDAASAAADDATARATAALEDLALEHGGGHVDRDAWGSLLLDAFLLKVASDGIALGVRRWGPAQGCEAVQAALRADGALVGHAMAREAEQLESGGVEAAVATPPAVVAAPAGLTGCLAAHAHDDLPNAIAMVWLHEWLALVSDRPR